MKTFAEITLDCLPQQAWDAVVDFAGRGTHSPHVKDATVVEGGELRPGKHLRLQIDNNSFTMTVEEISIPSSLLLTMRGPLFRGSHHYTVAGRTRDSASTVRIDAHYGGLLGSVYGTFAKGKVRRDLANELDTIRKQVAAHFR